MFRKLHIASEKIELYNMCIERGGIKQIVNREPFGTGVFFGSYGKDYLTVIDDTLICDVIHLGYIDGSYESKAVKEFAELWGISQDDSFDCLTSNNYSVKFAEENDIEYLNFGFSVQKYQMLLGEELGYVGVEGIDEQGTYWMLDGLKITMVYTNPKYPHILKNGKRIDLSISEWLEYIKDTEYWYANDMSEEDFSD